MKRSSKLSPLWKEEDWWAVWFAFLIILGAITGVVDRVPKIGKWEGNPVTVFKVKRDAATRLRVSDLKDPAGLVRTLQEAPDPLSRFIRGKFTADELAQIDTQPIGKRPSKATLSLIVDRLNELIRGGPIYREPLFRGVKLNPKTRELLIGSSALHETHLIDPGGLAIKLRDGTDPLTARLRAGFSPETLDLLARYNGAGAVPEALKRAMVDELNRVLLRKGFFEPFPEITALVAAEEREAAKCDVPALTSIHLNRLMLDKAFPGLIRPCKLPVSVPQGTLCIKLNRLLLEDAYPDTIGVGRWNLVVPLILLWVGFGILTVVGVIFMRGDIKRYLPGYAVVFIFAALAYVISHQAQIKAYGLSYALWALIIGLLISNSVGTPKWLLAGAKTEMFIKTGLVLLGAEIIFEKILQLGLPGLFVAWLVTPTVILFMFWFGTKVLKLVSKSLVIIIASATSVCGVSAAIAVAAASKAKKEELTLGVGMTLIFTVMMMVLMPMAIRWVGLDTVIGAAWMGGTIDSTGAVVAAGSMLGPDAEKVAAVVKMIQNILIGVVAFFVALYWVARVERDPEGPKPSLLEIWIRMPKFIVGFVAASLIFSFVLLPLMGSAVVNIDIIKDITHNCRGWFFCLAFISIGLESNFRDLATQLVGGKPIWLYIIGQSFNLILTLIAAYLAFGGILFGKLM